MKMLPLVNIFFLNIAFNVLIIGGLINFFESYLPSIIVHTFRYGKFGHHGPSVTKAIEIPKSSFKHFYALAIIIFSVTSTTVVQIYYTTFHVAPWIISVLDFLCGADRNISCTPGATLVALFLLTMQCYKRFYETFFIQVFAKTSKINFFQYLIGHLHYVGCIIAILGHSPGFKNAQENIQEFIIFDSATVILAIPTIALFTVAWLKQLQSNIILANLRKDKKSNKVITEKHFIPKGGWFEYVSSPHQLCEVLMYLALTPLLGVNSAWLCVILWVLSNQIETSLLSHWWYKENFSNYPTTRKAIVPYVL